MHYVPKVYLRNFAVPQLDESGKLYVFDFKKQQRRESTPTHSAREGDLYLVREDTNPNPLAVEESFGKVEGIMGRVLPEILEARRIPTRIDDYSAFCLFLAFQIVRVPLFLNWMDDVLKYVQKSSILNFARNKASRRRWAERMRKGGLDASQYTPEHFAEIISGKGDFRVSSDVDWKLAMGFNEFVPRIVDAMALRYWRIVEAPEGTAFFTTDNPIGIVANHPPRLRDFIESRTIVSLPLSPRLYLLGLFERRVLRPTLTELDVARFNSATLLNSLNAFAASDDIAWLAPGKKIVRWSESPKVEIGDGNLKYLFELPAGGTDQ